MYRSTKKSSIPNSGSTPRRIALALTGASGAIYGVRLLQCLSASGFEVHLIVSDAGRLTLKEELDMTPRDLARDKSVVLHSNGEIGASVASGSFRLTGTVICPCSANTLGAVALGVGDTLIARVGAVALKERWPLVVVPREAPYSGPLIENMKTLSIYSVHVIPASPSFYRRPQSIEEVIDTVIDRVLVSLGLDPILPPWGGLGATARKRTT